MCLPVQFMSVGWFNFIRLLLVSCMLIVWSQWLQNPKSGEILLSIIYHVVDVYWTIGAFFEYVTNIYCRVDYPHTILVARENLFTTLWCEWNRITMSFMCCKVLWELIVIPQSLYAHHSLFLVVGLNEVIRKQQTWLNRSAEREIGVCLSFPIFISIVVSVNNGSENRSFDFSPSFIRFVRMYTSQTVNSYLI